MESVKSSAEAYADGTPLVILFGPPARTKIISALLGERDMDLNTSDIARLAGVARSTVYDHLDDLETLGVVEQTRMVGRSPMYRIDAESEIVEHISAVEGLTLRRLYELEDDR